MRFSVTLLKTKLNQKTIEWPIKNRREKQIKLVNVKTCPIRDSGKRHVYHLNIWFKFGFNLQ